MSPMTLAARAQCCVGLGKFTVELALVFIGVALSKFAIGTAFLVCMLVWAVAGKMFFWA